MNYQLILSRRAIGHLNELEGYLARRFSGANAKKFIQRILEECESLRRTPFRGSKRDDIRPGLRAIGFQKRVTIVFGVEQENVVIYGVYDRGRVPR